MDRLIEKRNWPARKIAIAIAVGFVVLALLGIVIANSGKTRLNIESERLTVAQVHRGEFREYVPISGTVQPAASVYLDAEEGGIVQKIYVESGTRVEKGELILSFSNSGAQKANIEAETRLIDNLNQLRNSKISLTQSNLILKDQLLDVDHKIVELERTFTRYQQLMKSPSSQLSKEQFEATRDEIVYLKSKRELLTERIRRETELQEQQSTQIDSSIKRVNKNLEILAHIADSLEVRAPIAGYLSAMNAEVGQNVQRGQRIGQVDNIDNFRVRADIDQYYISKVIVGQHGRFEFDGKAYEVEVTKIYPEVTKDIFQADLAFVGPTPTGIKRGQTLQIDLSLSDTRSANVLDKGTFYRHTNGRWVYRLSEDGRAAYRTIIVVGRQNPRSIEIVDGLKPGDWAITSSYDSFNDVDELHFPSPVTH